MSAATCSSTDQPAPSDFYISNQLKTPFFGQPEGQIQPTPSDSYFYGLVSNPTQGQRAS